MSLLNKIFIYNFTSPKPSQVKYNVYVEALYINTAVSFKSNITKIHITAGLLFRFCYLKRTSVFLILVCDMVAMSGKLILNFLYGAFYLTSQGISLCVRENLTLSRKSDGNGIQQSWISSFFYFHCFLMLKILWYIQILTEVKHVRWAEYCFKKLNNKQI